MFSMPKCYIQLTAIIFFVIVLPGCSSHFTKVSSTPRPDQERLGQTEGTACGMLGLNVAPIGHFIPMALLGRVKRAHQAALNKYPRATGLNNVSISEYWYFPILGVVRCTTISGEAIR